MMKTLRWVVLAVLVLSFVGYGCSKMNRENYDKIKVGMKYNEVIEIIGQPDKCDEALGAKSCVWGDDEKNITITFIGNTVALPTMKGL